MIDRIQANVAPLKSKDRFGPCVANGRYLRTADGWCRRPANPNSSRARSRRFLRRGSVGLVRPPRETVLPTYSRVPSASRMKRATSARAIDERTGPGPPRAI